MQQSEILVTELNCSFILLAQGAKAPRRGARGETEGHAAAGPASSGGIVGGAAEAGELLNALIMQLTLSEGVQR